MNKYKKTPTAVYLCLFICTQVYTGEQKTQDKELLTAVGLNNIEKVTEALKKGAFINCYDQRGRSPLIIAASSYKRGLITFLLKHGANLEQVSLTGATPLIEATTSENITAIRVLLEYGANKNHKDKMDYTALDWARLYRNTDIMKLLGAKKEDISNVEIKEHTSKCYRCQVLKRTPSKKPQLSPSYSSVYFG